MVLVVSSLSAALYSCRCGLNWVCIGEWNVRNINDKYKRMEVADTFRKVNLDELVQDKV